MIQSWRGDALSLDPLFAQRSTSEIRDDLGPGGEIRKNGQTTS